jgi:GNAT superfamily N-acetyltransferase
VGGVADLTTRPYEPGDAAAVADLYNTLERATGGHPGYMPDELGAMMRATVRDFGRDTRLVTDPDGRLVAVGSVHTPPDGGFRVDLYGGVLPERQGQGLGRELLGWQLERAEEIHRAVAPDAEWQAETGAMVDDASAARLMRRFGLAPVRYFFEMAAATKKPGSAGLPEGLESLPYRAELERPLYEAHMEAFADHWGYQRRGFDEWVGMTLRSSGFRPELSRIAVDGGEIAAYVLGYTDADPGRLYIGQVGTRRPWRRRGLAAALLAEVLGAASEAGLGTAALGVDGASPTGAVGVYERAGFVVESRAVAYRRPLR